jgi:hypothetical protein
MRWYPDPRTCPHYNDNACPTCDFDRYYATTYPDCPWREQAITPAPEDIWCPVCNWQAPRANEVCELHGEEGS